MKPLGDLHRPRRNAARRRRLRPSSRPGRCSGAFSRSGVPIVPVTSKTRAEASPWRRKLGLPGPLVVESGGGILRRTDDGWVGEGLGLGLASLRSAAEVIARRTGCRLEPFVDMEEGAARRASGLSGMALSRARRREFSLPFLADEGSVELIAATARQIGLAVRRGGRFLHLTAVRGKRERLPAAAAGTRRRARLRARLRRPRRLAARRGAPSPFGHADHRAAPRRPAGRPAPARGPAGRRRSRPRAPRLGDGRRLGLGAPAIGKRSPRASSAARSRGDRGRGEMNRADVVVGIPSWNNAGTIGHVVDCAVRGLATDFGELDALVLNSDGSSADGTAGVVFDAGQRAIDDAAAVGHRGIAVESILYRGIPGKGSAFRSIFEESVRRGARAVVVLDADLRSVTPDWIARLVRPVLDGRADYVSPMYRRHKFDGTITNSIVYPLTTSLYGGRIRQPIGGDFGFSGNLAGLFLSKEVWEGDVARFGVDLWMTTTALAEGFRVGQAHLGAKIHDPKDPGSHLAAMMAQVVGTAFALMETYEERWRIHPPAPPRPSSARRRRFRRRRSWSTRDGWRTPSGSPSGTSPRSTSRSSRGRSSAGWGGWPPHHPPSPSTTSSGPPRWPPSRSPFTTAGSRASSSSGP